ncbi:MAG: hypothetical protein AAFU65_10020, partial [Pseudomonadota bacterium]
RTGLGALVGALLFGGAVLAVQSSAPPAYAGRVLFVLSDDSSDSVLQGTEWRAQIAQELEDPSYLPKLVSDGRLPIEAATELSDSLTLSFAPESGALLALSAQAMDDALLADALDTIAVSLVDERQQDKVLRLDAQLTEIETLGERLTAQDAEYSATLDGIRLPTWARSLALTLGRLEGELFGLSLRRRLGETLTPQMEDTEVRLAERIAALETSTGGSPSVLTEHLEAARELASIDWKRSHLLRARLDAEQALVAPPPLRVVQGARVNAVPMHRARIGWAGLIGAALGALAMFVRDMGRPEFTPTRDGPTLEANLNVRVIGSLPVALNHFAQRNAASLASVQADHLALHSVKSFGTALAIQSLRTGRHGPVLLADIDDAGHGGHALANLAVILADAGRRVLVVEAGVRGAVLNNVLVAGTHVAQADNSESSSAPGEAGTRIATRRGRIRFVVAEQEDTTEPPVPGAFMHYFDSVFIRCDRADRAARLAQLYEGSLGVLVGHHDVPIRRWQMAREAWREYGDEEALVGLVHGGHPLVEHRYGEGS